MDLVQELTELLGGAHVLRGKDMESYTRDWTGKYPSAPCAIVRPGSTDEVARVVKVAAHHRVAIIPLGGNTGLTGAGQANGELVVSLERLNRVRAIKPDAQIACVEAGVILEDLHNAVEGHDLIFPLFFGARGSARIGGCLATNAGGSNVVRYGTTRDLCLGLEVVLASGEVLNLMTELHKDNSGYDLRDLFIGAEGTLGIITAAVLKLAPAPQEYATAQIAVPDIPAAMHVLQRLQSLSGGAVEAFEYMPRDYWDRLATVCPDLRPPLSQTYDVSILVQLGGHQDQVRPMLSSALEALFEDGQVIDAAVAQNEAQRLAFWACRDAAAEVTFNKLPLVNVDISLPLDQIAAFFPKVRAALTPLEPNIEEVTVSHLGDGNLHYTVYPTCDDAAHLQEIQDQIDAVAVSLGGSISAEHGIGQSKLSSMRAHKDPVALRVMAALKAALDPEGMMNPGKVVPDL